MSTLPSRVRIFEVGPRDGLQNEASPIDAADKIALVNALTNAGFTSIEVGSFVSPKWVPQMADSAEVFAGIHRQPGVTYSALTPNMKGLEGALAAGATEVAIFASASESFSQKNINCSIAESIERFKPVMVEAANNGLKVRGYVSCVMACPYDGPTQPSAVRDVSNQLLELGCYEISLGDTIGVGTPGSTAAMLDAVAKQIPATKLAIHCHDTYGQALVNILTALTYGISVIDSSVAGLGGCPYAKGASGNVATEDVLFMLQGMGIETGIDLAKTVIAGNQISAALGRTSGSKAAKALSSH